MKEQSGPIVIYSRKSKFTGKGESIENQVEMCRQYIQLHFGPQAAKQSLVYEDEGFSGGTLDLSLIHISLNQLQWRQD